MKNDYLIPGFEPDEILDMAKSALKQVHERGGNLLWTNSDAPNLGGVDVQSVNLNEQYELHCSSNNINHLNCEYADALGAHYKLFYQNNLVTKIHQMYEVGFTNHEFDRQLDSADHGINVVAGTASNSKTVEQ